MRFKIDENLMGTSTLPAPGITQGTVAAASTRCSSDSVVR